MSWKPQINDPERRLALAYALADRRDGLASLWALDERLGAIVSAAREPMLGEIKLAWWRDALEALEERGAPAGEPLLAALADMADRYGIDCGELATLTEGWAALLEPLPLGPEALERHGEGRGALLFSLSARILAADGPASPDAGYGWALADFGARCADEATARAANRLAAERLDRTPASGWPRPLRPLAVLTALARRDSRSGRQRAQGSPRRLAIALWAGLTGR